MLKVAWSKLYAHPLPEGHRFPMIKYELIPEQLLYEGTISEDNLFLPASLSLQDIHWTHNKEYLDKLINLRLSKIEERRTGFPQSKSLVDREILIMGGTWEACLFALKFGVGINAAGGTHHAYADKGEGFCLLNDMAIAANILLQRRLVKKILIVDLDVHQGDGTASIFKGSDLVYTFSMHGASNYPLIKQQSHLDIPIPDKTEDTSYLNILKENLPRLIDNVEPDFIFYQAGVDILLTDKLGKLSISREGCKQRDIFVLQTCLKNKIQVCISMGGGYSNDIKDIVEAHCNTFRIVQDLYF